MSPRIELGTRIGPRPRITTLRAEHPKAQGLPTERIFAFVVDYKETHDGNSPTIREIGEGCGIRSTSLVLFYLTKLENQGLIRRPEPPVGSRYATKIEVVGGEWMMRE